MNDEILDVTDIFLCATPNVANATRNVAEGTFTRYQDGRRVLSLPPVEIVWFSDDADHVGARFEVLLTTDL